jgi:hypothetical protein
MSPYGQAAALVAEVEKLLVEAADLPVAIDEVDLQDPVAAASGPVQPAHRLPAAGRDVRPGFVAGDLLVREFSHQMPSDGSAVFPARLPGKGGDVLEQLLAVISG